MMTVLLANSFYPPKDKKLSSSKLEQEIRNTALAFLEDLKQGYSTKKWKFTDYSDYVLKTMHSSGTAKTTIVTYQTLLV